MIILHKGEGALDRIEQAAKASSGEVLWIEPDAAFAPHVEQVKSWFGSCENPGMIVVNPANAEGEDDHNAFEALRRMAKFNSVDVHLLGEETVDFIVDRVVTSDEEMADTAPGSQVGVQITELMSSEVMTPLQPAVMDIPKWEEIAAMTGCTEEQAKGRVNWMKGQKVFANNLYQVNIDYLPGGRAHVMIRRLDRQAIHNWQHFQEIKNQILGPECEAVELYPKESMLVDARHHYHLWAFTSPQRSFNIGFDIGRQVAGEAGS